MKRAALRRALLVLCASPLACGTPVGTAARDDGGRTPTAEAGTDAAVDPTDAADGGETIPFQSCVIAAGTRTVLGGCTEVTVPLWHAQPEGPTISLYVERVPAAEPAVAQLWLLEGGPGKSAVALTALALRLHETLPGFDIYMVDHRGTGLSTRFDCPNAIAQNAGGDPLPDCAVELREKWGDGTGAFSVTEAAWDVVTLVNGTRRRGQSVNLYGRSYGGYLVNRILQIAPDLARAVVLDSGVPASAEASTLVAAERPVSAGTRLLAACSGDTDCAAHLGNDPEQLARSALDAVDQCGALTSLGWSRELVQLYLSVALEDRALRGLIPAAFYRLNRCRGDDARWFDRFATQVAASEDALATDPVRTSSLALFAHLMLSELFGQAVPTADLDDEARTDVFSIANQIYRFDAIYDAWPRYTPDQWSGRWATSTQPRLVLHGELDSRVPVESARQIVAQAPAGSTRFVSFPTANHLIVDQSGDTNPDCGADILSRFLQSPDVEPDSTCASAFEPLEFSASAPLLKALSASGDQWGAGGPSDVDDGGVPPQDGGVPPQDGGAPSRDGGTSAVDGGTPQPVTDAAFGFDAHELVQ